MTRLETEALLQDGARWRALARDLVHGAAEADDLVQETWLRALGKERREGFSPRAWFSGLLRNVARERRRADARRTNHERGAAPAPEPGDDPFEVAARFDLLRRVLAFVDELAEPQRTTLIRRYVDGLEPVEIARRDGLPDATVRSRIKRGLEEVRARLDAERGGDRKAWMAVLAPWSRTSAAATATLVGGAAMKWFVLAAAGVLALAGVVVASGSKSRAPAPTDLAGRFDAERHGAPTAPSSVIPAETAERVVDAGAAPPKAAATDRGTDENAAKPGWRLEGELVGLDPATPWTGTIHVEPVAGFQGGGDLPRGVDAEVDGDRFAVDLTAPPAAPGDFTTWRAWQVTARDPAYVDVRTLVDVLDDHGLPRPPCTLRVELRTRRSARIRGRVVDETGGPVPSTTVGWRASHDEEPWLEEQLAETDASGRYSLEAPGVGPTVVATWSDPEQPSDLLAAAIRVDLHSGGEVEAPDLVMRRGVAIRGVVLDSEGAPEPGAIVGAIPAWTPDELADPTLDVDTGRTATSDPSGAFELRGLRRGRWQLAVHGRAGLMSHPTVGNSLVERATTVEAPADSIAIEDRLCRVELRMRIGETAAAAVRFTLHGSNAEGTSSCDLGSQADEAGCFTFLAVPSGRFDVQCERPDVEPTPKPIELAASDRRRVVDVAFEPRRPRASLALALDDPSGSSIGRAWIRLEPLSDPARGVRESTAAPVDGTFVVGDLEPGTWRATVRAGAGHYGCGGFFEEETFDVELPTPARVEKTVPLRPTGRLRAFASDADGKALEPSVTVADERGRRFGAGWAFEDANSASFSPSSTLAKPALLVPPPPPGRYRVEFAADGFFPKSVEVEVVRGETADVSVTLVRR